MTSFVPHSRQAVADPRSGLMTPPWYVWAQRIDDAVIAGAVTREQAEAAIREIALALGSPDGTIENIPPIGSNALSGLGSVEVAGQFVQLENDLSSPPDVAVYGTGPTGKRGWQSLVEGDGVALGSTDNALTLYALDPLAVYLTDEAGNLLTDSDGSPLLAEGPSTSQLPEGSNLYYTEARADARVDAGIDALLAEPDPFPQYTTDAEATTIANARAAAAVTALKAESDPFPAYLTPAEGSAAFDAAGAAAAAQTAAQAYAAALIVDSIADSDTTHAPSRNAVFDALARKATLDGTNVATLPAWFRRDTDSSYVSFSGGADFGGRARFEMVGPTHPAPSLANRALFYGASVRFLDAATGIPFGEIDLTSFSPATDNLTAIGQASFRWSAIYGRVLRPGDGSALWTTGNGSPEGVIAAPRGSLYTRLDGGASTTLYVKESGTGNTGWVAK